MAALDLSNGDAILKELYDGQKVAELTLRDHPFYALVPKSTNFYGRNYPLPNRYGNPQGRSRTFATAKANKKASKLDQFTLTRVKDYCLASIDNETLEATENDAGAFIDALTLEMDGAYESAAQNMSTSLFRDTSGYIGQVNAEPANGTPTFTLILKNQEENVNFEVGMVLVIWSAKSGGSQRTSDGSDNEWEIVAIDRKDGEITLSGVYDNSGDIAANDYIFVEGDRGLSLAGLEAWLPESVTNTPFFGVDRTVDVQRLAGIYEDYSSYSIEEALVKGIKDVSLYGGKPSHVFVNYDVWSDLELALGSKVQYVNEMVAGIGFTGIKLSGPKGTVNVIPDASCLPTDAFILQLDTWVLKTLKDPIRVLNSDGLKFLRENDEDAIELRVGGYGNLGCMAPAFNGRFKVK